MRSVKIHDGKAAPKPARRRGFMAGRISAPDDFDRIGQAEIEGLFTQHETAAKNCASFETAATRPPQDGAYIRA
ncbi:MAG: hypothetical protein P4L64_13155 [Caulobacteraceae bacterium]|nr:hypothetical protein [Caulobacteraceae bacterium]